MNLIKIKKICYNINEMEMIFLNTIKTIDLWTEQNENHIECFSGAFVDGFENGNIPFDTYKVIRNGNCIITSNLNELNISNKHNAIVFYKNNIPVRLMVINQNTDIDNCINVALSQQFNDFALNEIYKKLAIKRYDIDFKIFNDIKSLMYVVETALEEVYDADDLQALSIYLSELNYYHNTNI